MHLFNIHLYGRKRIYHWVYIRDNDGAGFSMIKFDFWKVELIFISSLSIVVPNGPIDFGHFVDRGLQPNRINLNKKSRSCPCRFAPLLVETGDDNSVFNTSHLRFFIHDIARWFGTPKNKHPGDWSYGSGFTVLPYYFWFSIM